VMISDEDDTTSLMMDSLSVSSDGVVKTIVWNYFETVTVLDLKKERCVHCKCLLRVDLMNETSHLHAHVKYSLRKKNQVLKKEKSSFFDQQRFMEKLVSMIIAYEYPFSIVDHVGFKNYSFCF
uniref:BED-type domain-containing protein n=1 Tax=Kalanchoe fedtschenkoi TaxID=63787 RepID=A0A7N0TJP3_KALFE